MRCLSALNPANRPRPVAYVQHARLNGLRVDCRPPRHQVIGLHAERHLVDPNDLIGMPGFVPMWKTPGLKFAFPHSLGREYAFVPA